MSIELLETPSPVVDPLEAIEAVAGSLDMEIDRVGESEVHLAVPGTWRDAGVWFTWRPDVSTLQMGAPLDLKVPENLMLPAARLVTMINERLWLGHFDLWTEDQNIVFRNAIVLPQSGSLDAVQAQFLIRGITEAIDRFYPAFNYLIWGGKSPQEALDSSLFETAGNA